MHVMCLPPNRGKLQFAETQSIQGLFLVSIVPGGTMLVYVEMYYMIEDDIHSAIIRKYVRDWNRTR